MLKYQRLKQPNIYCQELLSWFTNITNQEALVQRHSYKFFFWKVKKICKNRSVNGPLFSWYVICAPAPSFYGCPVNFRRFSEYQFQVIIDMVLVLINNYGKYNFFPPIFSFFLPLALIFVCLNVGLFEFGWYEKWVHNKTKFWIISVQYVKWTWIFAFCSIV